MYIYTQYFSLKKRKKINYTSIRSCLFEKKKREREKEILSFVTAWMKLEGIMLSEIARHGKTSTPWYHLHVESKRKSQTHRTRELKKSFPEAGGWGK